MGDEAQEIYTAFKLPKETKDDYSQLNQNSPNSSLKNVISDMKGQN